MRDVKRELDGADNRKKQAVAETIENQMEEEEKRMIERRNYTFGYDYYDGCLARTITDETTWKAKCSLVQTV